MGRKRNVLIRDYYIVTEGDCKCKICGKKINFNYISNLKRHVEAVHMEIYHKDQKQMKLSVAQIDERDKALKFSIQMSPNEIIGACVEIVTDEARPLKFFDSKAFKTLTGQIFNGLKMEQINSSNIMVHVNEKYAKVKREIKKLLNGKVFCLKIDTATRSDRSILGVNAQVIINKEIQIFTLAVIELKVRHTAENLKAEIESILKNFEIDIAQVYSITTDNGRNLVKCVELLSPQREHAQSEDDDESEYGDDVVDEVAYDNVLSVKCAAHTLQLAVRDFLVTQSRDLIGKVRDLAKLLRTAAFRYTIETLNVPKPKLDVATRWSSTFIMLKSLIDIKGFCLENETTSVLTVQEWKDIENIVSVLAPVHALTLKLQSSQLFLGDFYKAWLELKFELESIKTSTSEVLVNCIETRQVHLLENDTIYAALFLDPRFRRLLSREKVERARKHLKSIVLKIIGLDERPSTSSASNSELLTLSSSSILDIIPSSSSRLRAGLKELEVADSSEEDEICSSANVRKAYVEIDSYKGKRVDVDANLMEYWEEKKYAFPWLTTLACILHSVPATQVSVERAFSALKLVLSDLRYNLSEKNLEAILMVKLNSSLIPNMNTED